MSGAADRKTRRVMRAMPPILTHMRPSHCAHSKSRRWRKVPSMNYKRAAMLAAVLSFSPVFLNPQLAHSEQGNELTLPVNAGFVSTSATAHRRIPNTVADVSVGIQTQGAASPSVSRALAQRSQTLLDWLRGQGGVCALRLNADRD